MKKSSWQILLVLLVFLGLGFWQLDQIPGEWFGDISILHEEVLAILKQPWIWRYSSSAGPLYHHWVALWASVLGPTYLTYKIVSVLTGAFGLVGIYLFAKVWFGERVGWWSLVWAASSFWLLVWSRLGSSPQILTISIVAYSGWLLAKYLKTQHLQDWLLGTGIACLSWWTFPSLFAWPLASVVGVKQFWHKRQLWALLLPVGAAAAFWLTLQTGAGSSLLSYSADKLATQQSYWQITLAALIKLVKLLGSWHLVGDQIFRMNVPLRPHVDPLAGLVMLCGWGVGALSAQLRPQLRIWGIAIGLLFLPLLSPGISVDQVVSSGRTLATLPLVMIAIGLGSQWLEKKVGAWMVYGLISLSLLGTLITYFGSYQQNLPNHNSPYGRYIAKYIDEHASGATVKLTGCCWGEWGQPEPKGMYYALKQQTGRANIVSDFPFLTSCTELIPGKKYLLIFNPAAIELIQTFQTCFSGEWTTYRDQFNQPVFTGVIGQLKTDL